MQYFFILGRNPQLSLAELYAVLGNLTLVHQAGDTSIFQTDTPLDIPALVERMGGIVKAGEIIKEGSFLEVLKSIAQNNKVHFGFSFYSKPKDLVPKEFALALKKQLKEQGISSRWVESKEQVLSSVIVQKNHLIDAGAEFVFLENGNPHPPTKVGGLSRKGRGEEGESSDSSFPSPLGEEGRVRGYLIGRTLAIPDVESFGQREFGKPQRSIDEGMLPVQLARVMINLAKVGKDATILDPFCGSGTVLMEALAMGYTNVVGSDVSTDAVQRTKENITWLLQNPNFQTPISVPTGHHPKGDKQIPNPNIKILPCNVRKLSTAIKAISLIHYSTTPLCIVTEPSLGPLQLPFHSKTQMNVIVRDLANLYLAAFQEFAKILRPSGRVVFIFPLFQIPSRNLNGPYLNRQRRLGNRPAFQGKMEILKTSEHVLPHLAALGFTPISLLSSSFATNHQLPTTNSLIYQRPGQTVLREIVVLEKR